MLKKLVIASVLLALLGACTYNSGVSNAMKERFKAASNYKGSTFRNTVKIETPSIAKVLKIVGRMATKDTSKSVPSTSLPIQPITRQELENLSSENLYIVKLGHSSLLLKVYGEYWLIDPVFSKRASPLQFVGPERFHPTPITIDQLPAIDRVMISHNHYDHLDKSTVTALAAKTKLFMVPLGVEAYLIQWGISAQAIESFEWWQESLSDEVLVAFTPAQHFSGRGLNDRDKSLWGSWVIKTPTDSVFFSGDTGYFDGFKTIGEKYGPFDLTLIETGAYAKEWPDVHMMPEQSVQAHIDLQGKRMLPIHNGTFDLAFHPWADPLERVSAEAAEQGVSLLTPIVGEVFTPTQSSSFSAWWRDLK